ncbi:Type III restriction enzyme, res subunit family protein [Trichomonas vaginalis G3]|uniref:Type III restriction enzyme, res subunit family protein n=1 Tax=Trichomonas vaginalis (strain ATCC PRA-98 / G3) TaxID=412133 RepID=A2DKI9_TRIV3|nr:Type III restriction enzyme, res subunit family protein [Trichomonas vaginalis G3]|eukprot:XP_001580152.1 Type III restriction enzyme, res subunit family protein [Trichomonas vaginalis G3]
MSSEPWAGSTVESWLENVVESSKAEYPEEVVENITQLLLSDSSDVNIRSKLSNLLGPSVKTPVDIFLDWRDQIIKYFHQKYQNSSQTKQESKPILAPIKRTKPIKPVVKAIYKNTETINMSRYDVQATTLEKPKIDRKQLSDLPDWVRQCFNGCTEFNDIQSQIFETGYNTDDNMLVCAPTGAGKTNVAMITILHEIKKHIIEIPGIPPHIDDSPFLIVYITPMKALAMEIQDKLNTALKHLKVVVEEYTGDTSLSSAQVEKSQILVATPEKWDVATRKAGENAPSMRLKLLIIDEIHLLADDRGPVIESLVARTLRQVEQTQKQIRILGLSATLPNYTDVANFIRVPDNGLFYFGPEYRPVPLAMTLIGAKKTDKCPDQDSQKLYNELKQPGYKDESIQVDVLGIQVLKEILGKGSQTIVFVHSRNETSKYAHIVNRYLGTSATDELLTQAGKRNLSPQLRETIALGIGIHHAGLPRQDRVFVEQMFRSNMFQILICTSTLAWGVNLPAHSVVIKGTKVYNTELGKIEDIGILDVHQMFGRAGRPQFDTCGEAYLITEANVLSSYTKTLVNAEPIDSKFMNKLEDCLNAEVSLGTVASKEDAIRWATYTFMYQLEPNYERTVDSIRRAIKNLTKYGMVRYSKTTEILHPTHVGLVSSMHYIPFDAVRFLNENLKGEMEESELIDCVFASGICDSITVRKNEYKEMEVYKPVIPFASAIEEVSGKVNFLLQTYISREPLKTTTLQLDQGWVADNISRIFDAIFEISVEKGWCFLASFCLDLCKMVQRRMWWCRMRTDCPLIQIMSFPRDDQLLKRIIRQGLSIDDIKQIDFKELCNLLRGDNYAAQSLDYAKKFPSVRMSCYYQPISDKYLNIVIDVTFPFEWDYNICSQFMNYKIFIEDGDENIFYIASEFSIDEILAKTGMQLNYCVPIALGSKSYIISITSSEYLAAGDRCTLKIERISKLYEPYKSALVPLMALPIAALNDMEYMKFFGFKFFNEIQTQLFYQVYHTDANILLCAPNGTGKSVIGELAIFKQLLENDDSKILYLNPLQISLDEKISNWKEKLPAKFCWLSGDFSKDCSLIQKHRIIAANPEDFDNVSKVKSMKIFLSRFKLIIIDDIHMMNTNKGALIEVIVDRMRRYCRKLRFVVIGNTVANPIDLAVYFEVELKQTFNFPLEARPVEMKFLLRGSQDETIQREWLR